MCKSVIDNSKMGTGLTVRFDRQTSLEKNTSECMRMNQQTNLCSRLVQYVSVAMVAMTSYFVWHSNIDAEATDKTNVVFIHLLCVAAHFGAQCWVTFVAGFTMFFNLPRIMFGRLQSRLFPVYFGTTLMLSCVTLVTYVRRYNYETLSSTQTHQLILLIVCVILTFINSCVLAPRIVDLMVNVFEMEKHSGVAYHIGYCDRTELKKIPEYCSHYKKFRQIHGISGIANISTLVCNSIYIYSLAKLAASNDLMMKYCENN